MPKARNRSTPRKDATAPGQQRKGQPEGDAVAGAEFTGEGLRMKEQPFAKAVGTPEEIPPRSSAQTKHNIVRQNESADFLASEGVPVEHYHRPRPDGKEPDFKIGDDYFDHLNVSSSNLEQARKGIKAKVRANQADRVVVRLDDTPVTTADLIDLLGRRPLEGLRSLIVIEGGSWIPYVP